MRNLTRRVDPAFWIVLAVALLLFTPAAFWMGIIGARARLPAWGFGGVVSLGLAALAMLFVAFALANTPGSRAPGLPTAAPTALDARAILDARYAKGEISRDEYLRMRADLLGPAH